MRQKGKRGALVAAMTVAMVAAGLAAGAAEVTDRIGGVDPSKIRPDVAARLAKYAATPIEANLEGLGPGERRVLDKLIEASRLAGEIFLRQAWADNPRIRERLAADAAGDPVRRAALLHFDVNAGPWDRLDGEPFLGDMKQPPGAGFYPPGMSREEFEAWIRDHPGDAEAFKSSFTIIRREGSRLVAIPYSKAYREWLDPAAARLREAAGLTDNASLRRFLEARAAAFLSDDYYASDVAWMDLDSRIEITIGPYETYEDRLFGYKTAFEAFVTVKDPGASARLDGYKAELPALERNLPIPDEHKNLKRGTESPIGVVDEVHAAGDTRAGVQTIAFNLPNDERVREAKGSKKILLRNVMDAKFRSILRPIAGRVVAEDQLPHVTSEAFFNETLFHELSHGLGPGRIRVDGRETEARLELKELYGAHEEAKADVMGVWNVIHLIGKGRLPESMRRDIFVTYLAGMFRSVRFGIEEAHGRGVAMQYNYLREKGAIVYDPATGRHAVDFGRFEPALRDLLHDLCMVQARGDYAGAKALLDRYAKVPPEWQAALGGLEGIPVDIRPVYPAAGEKD